MISPDKLPNRIFIIDPNTEVPHPLSAGDPERIRLIDQATKIMPCDNPIFDSNGNQTSDRCPYWDPKQFCKQPGLPVDYPLRYFRTNGEALCSIPKTLTNGSLDRGYGWTRLIAIFQKESS